ncbi:DUF2147 domain-containing protein [Candidatus Poribacteria bacterium]|nr:DUF2147 domain-containing protein [Candidatus Poribacteria bacterium]
MRKALFVTLACVVMLITANVHASEADAILGQWFTDGGESIVEIYKCNESYCGKIIWLKEPKNTDGTEKTDSKNPDVSKKARKVLGMDIVWGFQHKSNNAWSMGNIYDPKSGKTYSCSAKLDKDNLNIRGFIGVSLLGRTTVWKRKQ